jgi:ribulose-bisphosphate carboxylase large chain
MSNLFTTNIDPNEYVIGTYEMKCTKNLREGAWNLAIGQSVGNPLVRNKWESDELFENHSCKILHDEEYLKQHKEGIVQIGFPEINTDWECDGVTQLLVQMMGGQLDIDIITKCRLKKIDFPPKVLAFFKGPKYGLSGMREYTGVQRKPLLGGIIKPKTGITPDVLLEMVKQMVEGGVNFIKEDEIMANPRCCPIEERVPLIMNYLKGKNVVYAVCINGDPPHLLERVRRVYELGGNGVHINFWAGLGVYRAVRNMDLPLFLHFQKY